MATTPRKATTTTKAPVKAPVKRATPAKKTVAPVKAPAVRKLGPIAEQIKKTGRCEVVLADEETTTIKRGRSAMRSAAYSAGFKGEFWIRKVGRTLYGWTDSTGPAKSVPEKPSKAATSGAKAPVAKKATPAAKAPAKAATAKKATR